LIAGSQFFYEFHYIAKKIIIIIMDNKRKTLTEVIARILKDNPNKYFTSNEIAKKIVENYPDWSENKRQRSKQDLSNDIRFITQIQSEILSKVSSLQNKDSNYQILEEKPRKLFYSTKNNVEKLDTNKPTKESNLSESDLYPLLSKYLHAEFNIGSKRIDEKRSKNSRGSGGNKWLFPDMVGLEIVGGNWQEEIKKFSEEHFTPKGKLWSFEVKIKIDNSNVREVFFQTVSNSSWANYGYLVTSEIIGRETINELRILAGLHGIGVIRIDINDITKSQIIFLARERSIDLDNANRLAEENRDFKDYIIDLISIYKNPSSKEKNIKNWFAIHAKYNQ